ncbi:hypothetical protein QP938_04410 [Porticoccaceae bacterium LTM1]|nr:hypothetical protein QP938_04410 [Porticoccaceae bacterium LTM1]
MSNWQQFLESRNAQFKDGLVVSFGENAADYSSLQENSLLFALEDHAVITLTGGNGSQLLQGQVTCDIKTLNAENSLFGAHCTPKGRVIALFHIAQWTEDTIALITRKDQVETLLQSLGKFAPFFKTEIRVNEEIKILGLSGEVAGQLPELSAPYKNIPLPDGRQLLLIDNDEAQSFWEEMENKATTAGLPLWELMDIRAGLPKISTATIDSFVPQMINLQALDAISFKKGCYSGQEVVARMKYLGKLKKRMYRLSIAGNTIPTIGNAIYLPNQTQSIGTVVNAQQADENQIELLAVLTEAAAQADALHVFGESGSNSGPLSTVTVLSLPYQLEQ